MKIFPALTTAAIIGLALTACGKGETKTDKTGAAYITGSVFTGPVSNAAVYLKDLNGNTLAGPAYTSESGWYTLQLDKALPKSGYIIESSGGTYHDVATGSSTNAGTLAAYVEISGPIPSQIHLTPGSTIITHLIGKHGINPETAKNYFEQAFGYLPELSVAPVSAAIPPPGHAQDYQLLAGVRAAAFSQLTHDLAVAPGDQYKLLAALAEDLSDGILDGTTINGSIDITSAVTLPGDIQNRFVLAMTNFHAGPSNNSGLPADKLGMLPFPKKASNSLYLVEYASSETGSIEGKTAFKLKITDKATELPAPGMTLSLMPVMRMASGMTHASPHAGCQENPATPGEYECTVYYLMPSVMSHGKSMGYWRLKIIINGNDNDPVIFTPKVGMTMGDIVKARLKGQAGSDMITLSMTGASESRNYYLFKDGLQKIENGHALTLFIAAQENMMNYPAMQEGLILNPGTSHGLTVASVSVEISSDGGGHWITASNIGSGLWQAQGITGMAAGERHELYIRLSINGEQKTTNGLAPSADNSHAILALTPQS